VIFGSLILEASKILKTSLLVVFKIWVILFKPRKAPSYATPASPKNKHSFIIIAYLFCVGGRSMAEIDFKYFFVLDYPPDLVAGSVSLKSILILII